ncbi:pimeloyl-ACP methyl ester carboxylesterase [Labedella gwakjiensis]|uniref:Alpha/beta fold hydrolase n=1 Tax=Labedella gwakjiensis TaxID=390269 RepID=A0A2P8GVY5_9MICO|nr:alpha/beta fold hydrolase [Labedella gwakjiensis]PSL38140.1 pimeloyl-ACP methyl ester carboxylesterase [Labedella gwakjiensis]RUQ87310.1 alpha/beta fold hydrolase [Labedella gwakjiensis]
MERERESPGRTSTDVTVRRVRAGKTFVRVNTIGTSGDRPFLLVPGIGVSSDYFERLAPNLNRFGPVHAVDLPGFAGVPHPGRAMSIREYANLLGRVIDELELDDPVIVGHSMGTQVVTDLAARRPGLSTIVLIGPVVNPAERRVLTQAARFLQASWFEPGRVKALAIGAYAVCGFRWFSRILPRMMRFPIEQALPHVRAHTLVIRGEHDYVAPRDWVERIGELLPSARLWEIPGAAHSVMHAHAPEVARLCVEHAEQPVLGDGDVRLRHFPDEDIEEGTAPKPSFSDAVKALRARFRETIAVAQDDDAALAAAKTEHAEAMQSAHDRAVADQNDAEKNEND